MAVKERFHFSDSNRYGRTRPEIEPNEIDFSFPVFSGQQSHIHPGNGQGLSPPDLLKIGVQVFGRFQQKGHDDFFRADRTLIGSREQLLDGDPAFSVDMPKHRHGLRNDHRRNGIG